MKIAKRNGKSEEFDRKKIEQSVLNAGADQKTAQEVAKIVSGKKCNSTNEIRRYVSRELKKRDLTAAQRYDESRCFVAKRAIEAAKGTARLSKEAMTNLNLKSGDEFYIIHKSQQHTMKVEKDEETNIQWNEIRFSKDDLETIGISDGTEIIAKRQ